MNQLDPAVPVPIEAVLDADRDVHVANIELGVTFYLDNATLWGQRAAMQVLQRFVQLAPRDHLLWYTTSRLPHYKRVRESMLPEVLDAFSVHWLGRLRHGFEFVLADDTGSECAGFRYVEVDETRVERTSLLELTLPAHFAHATLQQLAELVVEAGPIWCGIGGYALRYNPQHKGTALSVGRGWAKRYVGLDIQDRERMPWLIKGKLPGVSWLNYLGPSWLAASGLDVGALAAQRFTQPINVTQNANGVRIIAGAAPSLGDLNRLQEPKPYEELAQYLQQHFVAEPPALDGKFVAEDDASAWFRRHIEPMEWR